jgi:hypothetical protein
MPRALEYGSSIPTIIVLADPKEISLISGFKQLRRNYVPRCYASSSHPVVGYLEVLLILVDNPGRGRSDHSTGPYPERDQSNP